MEFEIEDSFKTKIDLIIKNDLKELFGDDEEDATQDHRQSIISPKKPEVKTALPLALYEIMVGLDNISVDNPYNRLLTAIELWEDIEREEINSSADSSDNQLSDSDVRGR